MKQKLKPILLAALGLLFVLCAVSLFVSNLPAPYAVSGMIVAVFSLQSLIPGPAGFILTGFATLFGVVALSEAGESARVGIGVFILTMWAGSFLLHVLSERWARIGRDRRRSVDNALRRRRELQQEMDYYEGRLRDLRRHAEKRRGLSSAARELGSLLDPVAIQQALIARARSLFPERPVVVSYGQTPDAVERFVIQRRQPLLVPSGTFKGTPLLAAPITAQKSVAGVLRVGGAPGEPFGREDLRMAEILAGLASLALDNSLLFERIQDEALRDGLTGLLTHRAFQDVLEAGILEASRYNQSLSLILTDVDHFKSVNDAYGHQAGDQVLQGFAHVFARNVRDVDTVSRYGGEEFIAMLIQTDHRSAIETADQIRRDLEAQPFEGNGRELRITGSFGVATFPQDATTAQQLIRIADQRLYQAKNAGRNRVEGRAA